MKDTPDPRPLRIDIVSDVVCPWCRIGWGQLDRALSATGSGAEIHWHPFELNPAMPPEGQNMAEHIAEKYGSTLEQSAAARQQMAALGESLGFTFNWSAESRMWNTFRAHQLIEWAVAAGRQHHVKLALFAAHFTDQRDISELDVLCDVAAGCGLDPQAARAALDAGEKASDVRAIEQFWQSKGITGVPAMIFDQRYLLTGAQGEETYAKMILKCAEERAA